MGHVVPKHENSELPIYEANKTGIKNKMFFK